MIFELKKNQKLLDLIDNQDKKFICAKVDGKIKSLDFIIDKDGDYDIEFLTIKSAKACRIYEASLRYIAAMAVKSLDESLDIRYSYYISRSIYGQFVSKKKGPIFNYIFIKKIKERMKEIIEKDIPFKRIKCSKDEALKLYRQDNKLDKIQVLKYRKENFAHIYEAKYNSFTYSDYLYEELVPSSGYIKLFDIKPYTPGFLLFCPKAECGGEIPPYIVEGRFASALSENASFAMINNIDTTNNINKYIHKNTEVGLICISEARVNRQLVNVTDEIVSSTKPIKLICIAGPSSSGKTSFANRLMYELMSVGKRTIRISIDDFYIPKGEMKEGTDLESLDAIDVDLFNETMSSLIIGKEAKIPHYDFKTNQRTFAKPIKIDDNQLIIIEGIHALNSDLTQGIPDPNKFKIYISPQSQVNIDYHTPLSMSNLRLLRRIVRDNRTRGSDAKETISMWNNVRNGEFKYIYPTQENADFVFDSFYFYEPCALREYVLPLLDKITINDEEYDKAFDLKQMIKYFTPIDEKFVPCNSLMREFLGGSCFKDAK